MTTNKPSSAGNASVQDIRDAVAVLSKEERLRLFGWAKQLLFGTEFTEPQELMNETLRRALAAASGSSHDGEKGRVWRKGDGVEFPAFLHNAMWSIADGQRGTSQRKATSSLEELAGADSDAGNALSGYGHAHPDVVEEAIELEDDEEDQARLARVKADAELITRHFANDQNVSAILEGEKEGWSAERIREEFGMSKTEYDTARRRLRRELDKLMPGRRKK